MTLALISMLTHDAGQVKIRSRQDQAQLLLRFAAGASVGRFALLLVQLSATGTPKSEVRFLRAFEQQRFVTVVETIKQGGDLIRQ